MSKELEALERYGYHCNHYVNGENDYKLIETALKRLETLEEEKQSFDRQLEKKLKALEILSNKKHYTQKLLIRLPYECRDSSDLIFEDITQEEYDLLKEVLL